jgi:hypothetical protein
VQYSSMSAAMKDCCDNVLAIVEIYGPSNGLDCSLFTDSGGTQYRNSGPNSLESDVNKHDLKISNDVNKFNHNGTFVTIPDEFASLLSSRDSQRSRSFEIRDLNTTLSSSLKDRIVSKSVTANQEQEVLDITELRKLIGFGPSVTVRMLPSAVPDTRNFEWSPRKSGTLRQQSGQLLYFLSGFLSIQLEVQNFLSCVGLGGPIIPTKVFGDSPDTAFLHPNTITRNIAEALMKSSNSEDVYDAIVNTTSSNRDNRPTILAPLYHRAFPTHRYEQQTFWHVYGSMITTALIIFFSLPAAVIAGAFRREVGGGQLDSLSTLPGSFKLR